MKIEYRNNVGIAENLTCYECGANDWEIAEEYSDGSTGYECTSCGEAGLIISPKEA